MSSSTTRSTLRHVPIILLVLLSIVANVLTLGAPVSSQSDSDDDESSSDSRSRSKVSAPAAVAGVIFMTVGLYLCFAATMHSERKWYKKIAVFFSGFFFFGNFIYIAMANIGVKIPVWLLLGPLLGGCLLGGFRMIRPPGAEVLGPIAIHCFSLWLLGLRPSGLITSKAGQIALMVVLDLMGFMFVFIPSEHVAAAVGFSMLGAYTFFAGTDFFARSGFVKLADTFINSKSIFEASERSHGTHYTYTTLIVLTAIAGVYVQLRWGDKEFSFDKPRKKLTVLKVFWHGLKALIFCGMDNISCCGVEDLTCENFCGICCYCIPMPIRRCCCCGIGVPHDDGDVAEK